MLLYAEKFSNTIVEKESHLKKRKLKSSKHPKRPLKKQRKLTTELDKKKEPEQESELKMPDLTMGQWEAAASLLFSRIFTPPKRLKGVTAVTTNGVAASWSFNSDKKTVRIKVVKKQRKTDKQPATIHSVENLLPGNYDLHGKEVIFQTTASTTIIAVDPGFN